MSNSQNPQKPSDENFNDGRRRVLETIVRGGAGVALFGISAILEGCSSFFNTEPLSEKTDATYCDVDVINVSLKKRAGESYLLVDIRYTNNSDVPMELHTLINSFFYSDNLYIFFKRSLRDRMMDPKPGDGCGFPDDGFANGSDHPGIKILRPGESYVRTIPVHGEFNEGRSYHGLFEIYNEPGAGLRNIKLKFDFRL